MKQIIPGLWEVDEIGDFVHCYIWEWKQGLTLIDTGMPGDVHTILDAITAKGWALHNVRRMAKAPNSPLVHLSEPICIGPLNTTPESSQQARRLVVESAPASAAAGPGSWAAPW